MFRKRKPKQPFSPGTFIPTHARVLAILQLCLVFSVICYNLGEPFLNEVFLIRKQQSLYQLIMGDKLFNELPLKIQENITNEYDNLLSYANRSFSTKITEAITLFLINTPPFKLAWLALSIILPIMLLKKIEGAKLGIWLIPLVTLLYSADNILFYPEQPPMEEKMLYPTETYLINNYSNAPLPKEISQQQELLKNMWNRYLANEWSESDEKVDPPPTKDKILQGTFNFNVALLEARKNDSSKSPLYEWKQSPLILFIYICWNFYFALTITIIRLKKKFAF